MSNSRSHKEQIRNADSEQRKDASEISTYKVMRKYGTAFGVKGKEDKGNPGPGYDGKGRPSTKLSIQDTYENGQ